MHDLSTPRFWMVWSPQGRAPTFKHHEKENAYIEAERLARSFPNQTFFVLKAIGGVQAKPIDLDYLEFSRPNQYIQDQF